MDADTREVRSTQTVGSDLPVYRQLYRRYLARYSAANRLKFLALRASRALRSNPTIRRYSRRFSAKTYHLVSMAAFRSQENPATRLLEASGIAIWPGPKFANAEPLSPTDAVVHCESPPLEIIEIADATPVAASNFILLDRIAIHPDYYEAERDVCMAELMGQLTVAPKRLTVTYNPALTRVPVQEAVSLLGQCAGNYAHFLTEVLPKLVIVDQLKEFHKIPLLVDNWMHKNHFALIRLFNKNYRQIIRVDIPQPVRVKRLIDVSPPAYAPPEYRAYLEHGRVEQTPANVYKFNSSALDLVRRSHPTRKIPRSARGERLFIARKSPAYGNGRNLTNIAQMARGAERLGFEIIEPGSMTPPEQIAAFRKARFVIAPIGAALANLIFTPKGCRVLCLSPVFEGANYYYFSNLMGALGHDLTYVLGKQTKVSGRHPFHHDYTIDMDAFYAGMKMLLCG
jgi:capsular polysaccharide biosynthesis protein